MLTDEEMVVVWTMLCMYKLYQSGNKVIRHRRYKVRPINRNRHRVGQYEILVKYMRENDHEQFFKYTRMSVQKYDELLNLVSHKLQRQENRSPLSPGHRLTMTLHFLSQGSSMQEIAWSYYIGKSTVHYVIKETCEVLWELLSPIYLAPPSFERWTEISNHFYDRWNMPNCVGAVDGKYVNIQAPKYTGTDFFNHKKSFSIVLMAVCDAYYKFTLVDIGGAGSNHDSTLFRNSAFGIDIMSDINELQLPETRVIPKTQVSIPCFMVADQAFPLHKRIMRPYPGDGLSEKKLIFNYRISRARRVIENTFGILVQRWRILRRPILGDVTTCESITKAAVVLHNYIQKGEADIPDSHKQYCPTGYVDYDDEFGKLHLGQWRENGENLKSIPKQGSNNYSRLVSTIRDTLADYFRSSQGLVTWQENHVNKGSVPKGFE